MKKVFIPTNTNIPLYKQFPTEKRVWGDYDFFLGENCDECDYVVIMDTMSKPLQVKCKAGGVICFPMEAESIKRYTKKYLQQFDAVFSFQDYILRFPNAKFSIPPFPWMLIYDFYAKDRTAYDKYDYFEMPDISENRINKFCLFTSNKKMSRGHCDRLHFVKEIKKAAPDIVDIYGSGFQEINIKYDVMSRYKYCIVIENEKVPYWRTEKLSDSILAGCYSLYYGDPMINDLFSSQEVESLDLFDIKSSVRRMREIIEDNLFAKKIAEIQKARNKVLTDWNTFSIISKCLDSISYDLGDVRDTTIIPFVNDVSISTKIERIILNRFPYWVIRKLF